jgi:putative effector of murein hydrolase LrgA (UPF0299 family)
MREVADMYAGWMIAGMVLATIATVIVWGLIVGLLLRWVEDRRRHRHAP